MSIFISALFIAYLIYSVVQFIIGLCEVAYGVTLMSIAFLWMVFSWIFSGNRSWSTRLAHAKR